MSRTDPSILSRIQPVQQPALMERTGRILTIRDMMQRSQMQTQQMAAQKEATALAKQRQVRAAQIRAQEPDAKKRAALFNQEGMGDEAKAEMDFAASLTKLETDKLQQGSEQLKYLADQGETLARTFEDILKRVPEGQKGQAYKNLFAGMTRAANGNPLKLPDPATFGTEEDILNYMASEFESSKYGVQLLADKQKAIDAELERRTKTAQATKAEADALTPEA